MATKKSSKPLPDRVVIEERLEQQRRRLWQVQGICACVAQAAEQLEDDGQHLARRLQDSLCAVDELVGDVASALEPLVLLKPDQQEAQQ